jgi:hypothetical protein
MITKQVVPRQTIRFRRSFFDFQAAVKRLSCFLRFGSPLKVPMYFERQGDQRRCMAYSFPNTEKKG